MQGWWQVNTGTCGGVINFKVPLNERWCHFQEADSKIHCFYIILSCLVSAAAAVVFWVNQQLLKKSHSFLLFNIGRPLEGSIRQYIHCGTAGALRADGWLK